LSPNKGKVLTQRYNEWAVIRTLYAVFAILPAAGGWSIGQYTILNGTFLVNSVANEMHTVSNRWVFTRGTVGSVYMDEYHFRRLAETVYLSEMCKVITNRHYEEQYTRQAAFLDKMEERITSVLPENELLRETYGRTWDVFRRATSTTSLDQLLVSRHKITERQESEAGINATNLGSVGVVKMEHTQNYKKLYTKYHWSSDESGEGACGEVEVDYGRFLVGQEVKYGYRSLKAYQNAHVEALEAMIGEIEKEVQTVSHTVYETLDGIPESRKMDRQAAIAMLPDIDTFSAMKAYFFSGDRPSGVSGDAMDRLINDKLKDYLAKVRIEYNRITDAQADLFDELITEIQRRQVSGSTANYLDDLAASGETLPDKYQPIADDNLSNLLENTKHGWMYAGFKWWDMSRASANAERLANHKPTMTSFRHKLHQHPEVIQTVLSKLDKQYTSSIRMRNFNGGGHRLPSNPADTDSDIERTADLEPEEANKQIIGFKIGWLSNFLFSAVLSDLDRGDALMSLQRGGHRLLTASATFLTAAGASNIAANVFDTGGGWVAELLTGGLSTMKGAAYAEIFRGAAKIMMYLSFLCLAVGILYAVYLPLLPAMIWTFGVIGWLEKLISLIVIFPLWMVGHIVPDGDGLVNGVGRQGYVFATNVLARPLVMTLSMSFAMISLEAITGMLAHFYTSFIPSAHAEYSSGLFVTLGSFVVFSGFVVIVAHMILGWIFKIPDEIPFYLGGTGGNFGEGEAKGHSQSVAGMVFHQTQGTSSLMSGGGKDPNQKSRKGRNAMSKAKQAGLGFDKN
tara:strand:- start:66 stop:2453 length:2388 start_codon:yes stop_codon:yes gene_type:complete